MKLARIAIFTEESAARRRRSFGVDVFSECYGELLAHRGVTFRRISSSTQIRNADFDVLVVAFDGGDSRAAEDVLRFAEAGGIVVCAAGLDPLAARLGYRRLPDLGAGYLAPSKGDARFAFLDSLTVEEERTPLRYLAASPWVARDAPAETFRDEFPFLVEIQVGSGLFARFAVDVAATVVALRQGPGPVLQDGAPAPDGTAEVDDGVLKADDMIALDYDRDRRPMPSGIPYFSFPYADFWRELFVGYLVRTTWERGLAVPFVGYWPSDAHHAALISHDSDMNGDEHATATLEILRRENIRSTWCILRPGYSREILEAAVAEGHEIALHYNAVTEDDGVWGAAEFAEQLEWLRARLPQVRIVSNKNHLTRVEGWGELFEWCERGGIEAEQTRGPSKRGNLGFIFGTCHPYLPLAGWNDSNRCYNVLEMGFLTPDMNTGKWGDDSLVRPLLDRVAAACGLAHFLFHQVHLCEKERVRYAFERVVSEARAGGFVFMTGSEVNDWERLRRSIEFRELGDDGAPRAAIRHAADSSGAAGISGAPGIAGVRLIVPTGQADGAHAPGAKALPPGAMSAATYYGVPCAEYPLYGES